MWKKSGKTEQNGPGHQGSVGILACWRKYAMEQQPFDIDTLHLSKLNKKMLDDIHYFQKQPWIFTDQPQWLPIFFRTKSSASSKMVCLVVNFMSHLELFCLQVRSKNDTMTHLHDCKLNSKTIFGQVYVRGMRSPSKCDNVMCSRWWYFNWSSSYDLSFPSIHLSGGTWRWLVTAVLGKRNTRFISWCKCQG